MNSINAKHLREFLTLSKIGNIAAAAKVLYITPQGLSKTIGKMEADLGVALFYRTRQGMILTPEGELLQKKAGFIIDELESISTLRFMTSGPEEDSNTISTIYLDLTNGEIEYFGFDQIKTFMDQNPGTEVVVNECSDHEIQKHVLDGMVDIGICEGPINSQLFRGYFLHHCRHCLVINKENPLSRRESLTFADLNGEPLIIQSTAYAAYENNMNRCLKAGFTPKIAYHASNLETAHLMASHGRGIVISVESVVEHSRLTETYPNLTVVPFADSEDCNIDLFMIVRKEGKTRPEVHLLEEFIKRWADDLQRNERNDPSDAHG